MIPDRDELLARGRALAKRWCEINGVVPPRIMVYSEGTSDFKVCAYYRDAVIHIWPRACSIIGTNGRSWSYPGYCVDRTPYGVVAHELAHHVDLAHGPAGGIIAHEWRQKTGEEPLTTYCPNDNEWFAEIFRLFVTNPDLLRQLRPKTYALLMDRWARRAEEREWFKVLLDSPRIVHAAQNKIDEVKRRARRDAKLQAFAFEKERSGA